MSTRGTRERLGDIFRDYAVTYRTEGWRLCRRPPPRRWTSGDGAGDRREPVSRVRDGIRTDPFAPAEDGEIDPIS